MIDKYLGKRVSDTEQSNDNYRDYLPSLVKTDSAFKKVVKHPRYVSDWASNVVEIDVTHKDSSKKKTTTFDLTCIWLPSNAPLGPFTSPVSLQEFPHWVTLIKLSINNALRRSRSPTRDRIKNVITNLCRFMAWCVINGTYEISRLNRSDFREYALSIAKHGPHQTLESEGRLFSLTLRAKSQPEIARKLISFHKAKEPSIRVEELNKLTGLLFDSKTVPSYLVNDLCKILDLDPATYNCREADTEVDEGKIGEVALNQALAPISHLTQLPEGSDKPAQIPYRKMKDLVKKLTKEKPADRTPNLSIEDAVKLLSTALSFVYDYSPIILGVARYARDLCTDSNNNSRYRAKNIEKVVKKYDELGSKLKSPVAAISGIQRAKGSDVPSLLELIQTLQTACMIIIGLNHGRRKQEILGEDDLPYGIYYGCVEENEHLGIKQFLIDIYVEKTIKDWSIFNCNQLVADAVKTLEELHDTFYPSGAPAITRKFADDISRQIKLFRFRSYTNRSLHSNDWNSYNFFKHSRLFLELSGVPTKSVNHRTHIFRRFFALIYFHRYENAELIHLKHALRHTSLFMTRVYVTDPEMREEAESIESLYRLESKQFEAGVQEVGKEYLVEKVKEIISGEPTAGGFTTTVFHVYKHLLRRSEFRVNSENDQAYQIAHRFIDKGYEPSVDKAGACFLSQPSEQERAMCYQPQKKMAETEKACLKLCRECPYHFDNGNYMSALREDAKELSLKANDFSLTLAERLSYEDSYSELISLIEEEERIQQVNAENMAYAKANAYLAWGVRDHIQMSIPNEQREKVQSTQAASPREYQTQEGNY